MLAFLGMKLRGKNVFTGNRSSKTNNVICAAGNILFVIGLNELAMHKIKTGKVVKMDQVKDAA